MKVLEFQIVLFLFCFIVLLNGLTFHNRIEKGGYIKPAHERVELINFTLPNSFSFPDLPSLPPGMNISSFKSYIQDCNKGCYGDLQSIINPQSAISLDNKTTTTNMRCVSTAGSVNCWVSNNVGFSSPGIVGCRNFCSNITSENELTYPKGSCYNSGSKKKCLCSTGYTGEDCSQISSENQCSGRGETFFLEDSISVCRCDNAAFTLNDCSGRIVSPPPVISTLPSHQYSSYDKYGNNHPVFNESTIAQIYINMPAENLTYYLDPENSDTKTYSEAEFIFYNGVISEKIDNIGIRIKGGISRHFFKKTWKISFNKYEKGRKFYQLKKLVFKGTSFDPSFLREKISTDIYYSMDSKVQRASFAMLYINGVNFGLQVMLEPVDDQFMTSRFDGIDDDDDIGPWYKCLGDLKYLGPEPIHYELLNSTYYKPENVKAENFTLLANFITILNTKVSDPDYTDQLEAVCDIESIVKVYVGEISSGQTDGLLNMNNYFIYFDPTNDNKATFFRHDFDLSFGVFDEPFYLVKNKNMYKWWTSDPAIIPKRGEHFLSIIFSVPKYQDMLTNYMHLFINEYFKLDSNYIERIIAFHDLVQAAAPLDLWHPQDYGWSFDDFKHGLTKPAVIQMLYPYSYYFQEKPYVITDGILEFFKIRYDSLLKQLKPFVH